MFEITLKAWPKTAIRNLVMTKRQELEEFARRPKESHWLSWLEAV